MTSGYIMGRSDRHFSPMTGDKLTEELKFSLGKTPVIYDYLRILRDYVEKNVRFWRMRPANELVKGEGLVSTLAAENEEYLIYFVNGGKAELEIPASEYELLNPRTGEICLKGTAPAGCFSFTAPEAESERESDWVLHIKAVNVAPKAGK